MSDILGARTTRRLRELTTTETPSRDATALETAYRLIEPWGSEALGRAPERVEHDGVPHLLWRAAEPQVLMLCHADTVFPSGTIGSRPFRIEGSRAFGPGVFDMKAGIVLGLEAAAAVARPERVCLLITGDEETGSLSSRGLIETVASECEAVLVLEPSLDGAMKIGRKGGSFYSIRFSGKAAHAGLEPELGCNALVELAHWTTRLLSLARPDVGTTVTPTRASAGTAMNVVPANAELSVDVRARSLAELERVDQELRALGQAASNGVSAVVNGGVNRPPLEVTGAGHLVELCRSQARRLGMPELDTAMVGGASDGNFTAALGIPTLDGLGPRGDGAHATHEWVDLIDLADRVGLLTGLLDALTTTPSVLATTHRA